MNNWQSFFEMEAKKSYYQALMKHVKHAYQVKTVYPACQAIFRAFELTPFEEVKVVIFGQDPYHNGQATGLAFSVNESEKLPASLRNIFQELEADTQLKRTNGDLSDWAAQGVLLLNTVLTVEAHQANSHQAIGWDTFIQNVIHYLNQKDDLIYVLWGKQAQKLKPLISNGRFIESAHPSPLSAYRGFLGSKPFSKINQLLAEKNEQIINW
ncbi:MULTISPECIES: uracil-DNA glycosylase [unclassified Enterococcus]|uniref:uracil-DNA glycosylase n=1 Tax=unclassified Enterococcus TaxID=2608891 RepID=UPI00155262CB|nr:MULTISPECIES: uracil-DNA glycosylase [unclassified Enterococcus]NPD11524.1 uracil-DNA glycosylase [Enterococcus sp. MMGLQ5-1]NPD36268.1 uracil-DNA glycosylase [Enterococcus sp. MMGLQ5-2]